MLPFKWRLTTTVWKGFFDAHCMQALLTPTCVQFILSFFRVHLSYYVMVIIIMLTKAVLQIHEAIINIPEGAARVNINFY